MVSWHEWLHPYVKEDLIKCKHCGGECVYDFCSESCMRSYYIEME